MRFLESKQDILFALIIRYLILDYIQDYKWNPWNLILYLIKWQLRSENGIIFSYFVKLKLYIHQNLITSKYCIFWRNDSTYFYRYIAVTQPIKYSKHKNGTRVIITIAFVWIVSAAIGSPIVLGLNTSPERIPELCVFYNSDFIIYSSLSSFYIPCIIMIYLYYKIFKVSLNLSIVNSVNIKFMNRENFETKRMYKSNSWNI